MAPLVKTYVIGKNRITRGFRSGFVLTEDSALQTVREEGRHSLLLGHIDSAQPDCQWGRLAFEVEMSEDMVLVVRAFASNELDFMKSGEHTPVDKFLLDRKVPMQHKEKLFGAAGGSRFLGSRDVLLYEQQGRYLWIWIELLGAGDAKLSDIRVYTPGDSFFGTFPEVYRTNGEFFRRYLSIFSSLYTDLQGTVDSLDKYLDVDTAPRELLPVFAQWLGLELGGNFLDDDCLRKLLKVAFPLIKMKGTRQAIEGVVRVLLDDPVYLVEQHLLCAGRTAEDRRTYERLYGDSPYGFTLLIDRSPDERLRSQLLFLVDQFKPIRSRVNIVFLGDCGHMDSYCYLDVNAKILQPAEGRLGDKISLDGMVYLQ